VAARCNCIGSNMNITPTILEEISPGYKLAEDTKAESREILNSVTMMTKNPFNLINIISLDDIEGANKIYKSIRNGFYSWITDARFLQLKIDQGELTQKDIKTLKYRDVGECELLAIAKASRGKYVLITNDQGEVYLHPFENIFEAFKDDDEVIIFNGKEWIKKIGYIPE